GGMQHVADGAGAVIALRLEAPVAAAPDVGPPVDAVGGEDRSPDRVGDAGGDTRAAVREDRGHAGGRPSDGRARSTYLAGGRDGEGNSERYCEQQACKSDAAPSTTRARQTIPPPVPSSPGWNSASPRADRSRVGRLYERK